MNMTQQDSGAFLYEERPDFTGFRLVMCVISDVKVMKLQILQNLCLMK